MNKINITQALEKFDSLLDKYNDLPDYVYTLEYRCKFYEWIRTLERKKELKNYKIVNVLTAERNRETAPFWDLEKDVAKWIRKGKF
ncbi:TPA: hypothetical protein JAJ15_003818 [Clostridioides difficile]|uniref:Uncharacterized protein n=1 Tax=Clostridioides difficile TaxID=1496 RepID=A0AAN5VQA3_CLODI|nr:hypothetical protein [Clostridioides difficile]MCU5837718.1 hypothetical protein [Clostridioides difficile]MDB0373441.1 hypothetical protein [Clostridioides difficile]MDB0374848.1 hypothetical protein [Clostridioides difficile]MDB2861879.1 hypothetical protein [Clostridioides difficile]HAT6236051.1 hypothetical protein [Clostridioides difficile]